jgi:hypothetical protein
MGSLIINITNGVCAFLSQLTELPSDYSEAYSMLSSMPIQSKH